MKLQHRSISSSRKGGKNTGGRLVGEILAAMKCMRHETAGRNTGCNEVHAS